MTSKTIFHYRILEKIGEGGKCMQRLRKAELLLFGQLESGYFDPYFPLIFPTLQSIRSHPEFR
ncbi:MAG: hypothetical protein OEV50_02795, partial [Candidatus Aminicenantes bacterium]|nr:hypothetical protein [Candidatus Aminicenantes bacterium]